MTTELHNNKGVYRGLPSALAGKRKCMPQGTGCEVAKQGSEGPKTICIGQMGSSRFRRIEASWSYCRADASPPEVVFIARDGSGGVLRLQRGQWCLVLEGVGHPDGDHLLRLLDLAGGIRVLAGLSRDADESQCSVSQVSSLTPGT